MKWDAIIFDMDGTLFDTEMIAKKAWFAYGEAYNAPVSEAFVKALTGVNMNAVPAIWQKYMPAHLSQDEAFEFLHNYMREYKLAHGPLPKTDLPQLFSIIKEKGYRIALCTSSLEPVIKLNFSFVDIEGYFDVIVNGSMTQKGKPAPDIYLLTAQKLNLDPKRCLVVEDSRNGVLSGHNAGMDVVMAVDLQKPDDELKKITHAIIYKLDDLIELI